MNWFYGSREGAENWTGPYFSEEIAANEARNAGLGEQGWTGTGEVVDPTLWIDCEAMVERFNDDNPEQCPVDDPWDAYWPINKGEWEEINEMFRSQFRQWLTAKGKREYYHVRPYRAVSEVKK